MVGPVARGRGLRRKHVVLVPDGMADEPQAALGGRTPLEAARTPAMDALARAGIVGTVRTVPPGMTPGSDVAGLAVFGYDPAEVYTGRSPLEASGIGVELGPLDVAYRCNFVTVSGGVMRDHTAGHISDAEARRCVAALEAALGGGPFEFYAGLSYRNLMVWRGGAVVPCTPPSDILDEPVEGFLPGASAGPGDVAAAEALAGLQRSADEVLAGLRPATGVWFWGPGRASRVPGFRALHGLSGAVVAAVDLVRGIGRLAGFEVIDVPGATGGLDTDYGAKARAALTALDDHDVVVVHVEAPDEASHMGDLTAKVEAIEAIDAYVVARLLAARHAPAVLVVPDHETSLARRAHGAAPVPFVMSDTSSDVGSGRGVDRAGAAVFSEAAATASGLALASGAELLRMFLEAGAGARESARDGLCACGSVQGGGMAATGGGRPA